MADKKYLKAGETAKLIGITTATLANWHRDGVLIPCRVLKSGHRLYSLEQVKAFLEKQHI